MPNVISELVLESVDLVDRPACAEIDKRTGRRIDRSVVALAKRDSAGVWKRDGVILPEQTAADVLKAERESYMRRCEARQKRTIRLDDPGSQFVSSPASGFVSEPPVQSKEKGKKTMSKLEKILKSDTRSSMDARISERCGGDAIEISKYHRKHPELQAAWEALPPDKPVAKSDNSTKPRASDIIAKAAAKLRREDPSLKTGEAFDLARAEAAPDVRAEYDEECGTPAAGTVSMQYFDSSGTQLGQKRRTA